MLFKYLSCNILVYEYVYSNMKDKLQLIINDIEKEINLITLYSNDVINSSHKWWLSTQIISLQKIVDKLKSL